MRQRRTVRSFVRREGRLTAGQQRALETLWPRYGLDVREQSVDLDAAFGRRARRVLEIGFGNGETLAAMARAEPQTDFLGIEVHRPGVGRLLMRLEQEEIGNVRVICADAVEVLGRNIPDAAFDAIHLFFPDPWPKKRHHKRRIVQPPFVALVHAKLRGGGLLHLATDWEDYAEQMLQVMTQAPGFRNLSPEGRFVPRPDHRPRTKFEERGWRLGHRSWDLLFKRID